MNITTPILTSAIHLAMLPGDSITLEQHIMQRSGLSQETIRTFLSPVEGGGSGLGPDALSAYCDYAADLLHPLDDGSGEAVQMFPGGNTTIARLMAKTLIPSCIDGPASVEGVTRNTVKLAVLDSPDAAAPLHRLVSVSPAPHRRRRLTRARTTHRSPRER